MVYTMEIDIDGGCRGNGTPHAIGAAAAHFKVIGSHYESWTKPLPSHPRPTNQRAEMEAIILALDRALELYGELVRRPGLDVTIYTDSTYAVDCMTRWIPQWIDNGWTTTGRRPVANKDLLEHAWYLNNQVRLVGCVQYLWIPREQNTIADRLCNENMDNQGRIQITDPYVNHPPIVQARQV
ncbi:unnamed protein product [Penicillium manginii]